MRNLWFYIYYLLFKFGASLCINETTLFFIWKMILRETSPIYDEINYISLDILLI